MPQNPSIYYFFGFNGRPPEEAAIADSPVMHFNGCQQQPTATMMKGVANKIRQFTMSPEKMPNVAVIKMAGPQNFARRRLVG
jgi:hypothetical protein